MPKKGILLIGNTLRRINEIVNKNANLKYMINVLLKNHAQVTHLEKQFQHMSISV